jgi:hypothetical protein
MIGHDLAEVVEQQILGVLRYVAGLVKVVAQLLHSLLSSNLIHQFSILFSHIDVMIKAALIALLTLS